MKKLPDTERSDYLSKFIIPNFMAMLDQDVYSTLFDIDGKIILSTQKNAQASGFNNYQESIGLSYADATPELLQRLMKNYPLENTDKIIAACHKIHKLLLISVEQKRVINFIDLIPYNNQFQSYLETYIPLFHPSGEVIAIQSLSAEFKMFNFNELIFDTSKTTNARNFSIPNESPPIQLPVRQHEILYLILQGIPQEYAAQILNIKRGTLARIISEQICPKFDIAGSNTKLLIEKAMKMGFQNYMPKSLWVPGIIVLDAEIMEQFNNAE